MTVEEFEKKFAELTKKHDELEKKFDKFNDNPDIDEVFDKQFNLFHSLIQQCTHLVN